MSPFFTFWGLASLWLNVYIYCILTSAKFQKRNWGCSLCLCREYNIHVYQAISRKVVAKSARDNPERYCRQFWVHCSSRKFERMAWEAMDVCLRVLKESNKGRFDSYSVRNSVLIISHITFWDCSVHIFSDNLSRNSCMSCSLSNAILY